MSNMDLDLTCVGHAKSLRHENSRTEKYLNITRGVAGEVHGRLRILLDAAPPAPGTADHKPAFVRIGTKPSIWRNIGDMGIVGI